MGQKIHPYGFRVGVTYDWKSNWFVKKGMASSVIEDVKCRDIINKAIPRAQISKIEIKKAAAHIIITIHTARPGIVIGQKGSTIDRLREDLSVLLGKEVKIDVNEVKRPLLDAQIVSEMVAVQLERKMPFRAVCKRMLKNVMDSGARGVKIMVSGRLGGAEIARREWFKEGSVPLQSISKIVDYGYSNAYTKYGVIGVKAWIYKEKEELPEEVPATAAPSPTEIEEVFSASDVEVEEDLD